MRATFYRRYVLSPIVLVCAVCCTLLLCICPAAQADDLPGWFKSYYQYDYDVGAVSSNSSNLTKSEWWDPKLMDSTYMAEILNSDPKPAPKGMPLGDAVRNGFTTFTDGAGNVQQIADVQKDLAQAVLDGDDYGHWAVTVAEGKSSTDRQREMARFRKANTRVAATSSGLKKAQTVTKASNASNIATATVNKSDRKVAQSITKRLTTRLGAKTAAKIAPGAIATVAKKAGGLILKGTNAAGDVLMAGQFGVFVGNGFVGLFNIDRTAECQTVTNNVARFVLGIDQACSKFSIGNVTVGNVSLSFPDNVNWIVYGVNDRIICRFKFTKFFVTDDGYLVVGLRFDPKFSTRTSLITSYFVMKHPVSGIDHLQILQFHDTDSYALLRFNSSPCGYGNNKIFPDRATCSAALAGGFTFDPSFDASRFSFQDDNGKSQDQAFDPNLIRKNVPKAKTKVEVQGSDGKTYTAEGDYQDQNGNVNIPSVPLPEGVTPTNVKVTQTSEDDQNEQIANVKVDQPDHTNGALDLIDTRINKSCYDSSAACAAWPQEVQKATGNSVTLDNKDTTKTKSDMPYKCVWQSDDGTSTELAIGECTVLSNSFTASNQHEGTVGSDPSNGEQINDPVDDPKPSDKVDYAQCVATDVSWNPVSWVFVPVKCALQWAFYPSQDNTETQMLKVQQKAGNSGIDQLPKSFNASFSALQNSFGQHCLGPEMHLSAFGHDLIPSSHPFSVCEGTGLEKLPTFTKAAFIVLSCAVCYITIRKWLSAMFGFGIGNSETAGEK